MTNPVERKGVIYAWLNVTNFKTYVGQSLSPRGRQYGHMARFRDGYNHPLYDAMRHDGLNVFVYVILEYVNASDLDDAETRWIRHLCSNDRRYGYNLEAGGRGKGQISEETRERLKIARRKRAPFSEASRKRMSLAHRTIWAPELIQRILQMYDAGISIRQIGRTLDLTTNRARIARIVKDRHD